MQIASLMITGVLTLCIVWRQWKYSIVQACVRGTGFFTAGYYLDIIFSLIMTGMGENGSRLFLQCMGIFVSKGIMVAILMAGMVMEQECVSGVAGKDDGKGTVGKCFAKDWGRKEELSEETSRNWQYLDGLTVGITLFFLLLAVLVRWGVSAGSGSCMSAGLMRAWIMTFFLAVLLVYDCSYYLHGKKQREKRRQFREAAGKREADMYLESVEEHYQRTRELWHDLKNHITLLSLLLEDGKYVQMKDYLHIFAEDVDSLTLPMKSGNLVVDALLAEKRARARKKDIAFRLSLCNLTDIPLKPNEICGIFGNLLDNALEANELVQEGRFIAVECEEKEYCYYIRIRNAAANLREDVRKYQIRKQKIKGTQSGELGECSMSPGRMDAGMGIGGMFYSAKADRRNQVGHGLGLRSVERIVHGCGGELAVDRSENQFTAAVRLPKELGQMNSCSHEDIGEKFPI